MTRIGRQRGMSLTTGFNVEVDFPATSKFPADRYKKDKDIIDMLCDEAQLPNVQSATGQISGRYLGEQTVQYPHSRMFTDVGLGFLCDGDMLPLKFLHDWYNFIYSDGSPLSMSDWRSEWTREPGNDVSSVTDDELQMKYQRYLNYIKDNSPAMAMEGGNAFDIAMTDAEAGIMDCKNDDECLEMLNAMKYNNSDDADEMMADDVIQSYIDMVEKFGLEKIQGKIESEMNEPEPMEGLNELVDPDKLPDEEKEKMDMQGDGKELDQTSSRLAKLNKDLGGGSRSSDRID